MERKVWASFPNVQNKITFIVVYLIAVENVAGELFAFSRSVVVALLLYLGSDLPPLPPGTPAGQLFQSKAGQWSFSLLAKNGVSRPSPPTPFPFPPKASHKLLNWSWWVFQLRVNDSSQPYEETAPD